MKQSKKRRKLKRLVESQQWKCYYCGEEMRDTGMRSGRCATATIEHIYPVGDIRRFIKNSTVAAHYKCNQDKNTEFHKKLHENYDPKTKPFMTMLLDLVQGKMVL